MAHLRLLPVLLIAPALSACGYIGAIDFPSFSRGKHVETTAAADPATSNSAVDVAALPPPDTGTTGTAPAYQATDSGLDDPLANAEPYPPGASQPETPAGSAKEALASVETPTDGAATASTAEGGAAALGKSQLLGGWTVTSGQETCQLFITLTSWTGGFRATTLGCNTNELKQISAWNLEGSAVVLAGISGSPIAKLSASGANRFDGQTLAAGTPISFYR
jgi:hypothetical protein